MPIKTKRWCDKQESDDGFRVLICRYRPRGLPKAKETWDIWLRTLGPSPTLHAAAYGKNNKTPLKWEAYTKRYLKEHENKISVDLITCLAKIVALGETITLLCSSACIDEKHCHRSLLKKLIADKVKQLH